jgi:uroporphyrinogen decarboxylase
MKGKERVLVALRRGQPDCVPVLPQIWLDHAARITGVDPLAIIERPELGFRAMLSAARHYGLDGFRTFLIYPRRRVVREGGTVFELGPDTGEKIGVVDMDGGWQTKALEPRQYVETPEDAARIAVPPAASYWDDGRCPHLQQIVQEAGDDFAVVGRPIGFTINWLIEQRGGEQALLDLATPRTSHDQPRLAHALLEKGLQVALEQTVAMCRAGIEVFYMGDASASASVISPRHFKEYVYPYYKTYAEEVHRLGGVTYVHVCGNARPLAELLIAAGIDCLDTMDPLGGVDPADIRRRVGNRAALMGGVSTLTLLHGTPAEVEAESRKCILAAGREGAYVLAAGCMVPRDTPPENVFAMVRAAHEFGRYPL